MADIKISQLAAISSVGDADDIPISANNVTLKVSAQKLKNYIIGTTDNSDLGADVSTQIQTLANKTNRNIVVIGNSYTGLGAAEPLIETFDNGYKYTSSGAGFSTYTDHAITFEDLLDDAIADTAFDNSKITDVLFISAMGDSRAYFASPTNYVSTLNTTLASIETKVQTNFPNCNHIKLTLAETRRVWGWSNNKFDTPFRVHDVFKQIPNYYGIEYIGWSGFNTIFVDALVNPNSVDHPTALGAKVIGDWIKTAYYGNAEYISKSSAGSVPFNYCANGVITALYDFTPDNVNLYLRKTTLTQGANVTLAVGGELINFDNFDIPCPAPATEIDTYSQLIRSDTGASADMFTLRILKDDYSGRCHILSASAPTASTVLATSLTMPNVNHISYKP